MNMRWADHVFGADGEAADLLVAASRVGASGKTMYVLGVGFDPRCLVGLQELLAAQGDDEHLVVRLELPGPTPASHPTARAAAEDNARSYERLVGTQNHRTVPFPNVHDLSNAGPPLAQKVMAPDFLEGVSHLVIDISSLPSSLYFPLIAAALRANDLPSGHDHRFDGEIQVVACENPEIDAKITELSVSHAAYVGGFRPASRLDSEPAGPTVWAPVVGERATAALRAVHALLEPEEVCPILPFPARHPRRSDSILLEHQSVLFDEFQVTSSNIVFADERNPFDLYRTLCRLDRDYKAALEPLGPPSIELSSHSSKLLSLGVLLAAIEHEMPLAAAVSGEYEVADGANLADLSASNRLYCLWLAGEPYS